MAKQLYLVTGTLHVTHNPGDDDMREEKPKHVTRIVWALHNSDAVRLFTDELEIYVPYDIRRTVEDVEAYPVIGTPDPARVISNKA